MISKEQAANNAVVAARDALNQAIQACELAGYGSEVFGPLGDAVDAVAYVARDVLEIPGVPDTVWLATVS